MQYVLRDAEQLQEELRLLGMRKKQLEDEFRANLNDISADASVIKAELDLLKSLGRI